MKSKAKTGRGQQAPAEVPLMAGDLNPDLTAEKPRTKGVRVAKKGAARRAAYSDRQTDEEERQAEERREGIFALADTWQGKELEWTSGRQTLYRIVKQYWPQPPAVAGGVITDDEVMAYLPAAWVLLYLCTHAPEDWRDWQADRVRWINEIEAWAAVHVPPELEEDAIALAFEMQRKVREMIAVARRRGGAGRGGK